MASRVQPEAIYRFTFKDFQLTEENIDDITSRITKFTKSLLSVKSTPKQTLFMNFVKSAPTLQEKAAILKCVFTFSQRDYTDRCVGYFRKSVFTFLRGQIVEYYKGTQKSDSILAQIKVFSKGEELLHGKGAKIDLSLPEKEVPSFKSLFGGLLDLSADFGDERVAKALLETAKFGKAALERALFSALTSNEKFDNREALIELLQAHLYEAGGSLEEMLERFTEECEGDESLLKPLRDFIALQEKHL